MPEAFLDSQPRNTAKTTVFAASPNLILLADEHSRGKSNLMTQLSRPEAKHPRNINVDAA
jgi:hypothetical protein